MMINTPPPLAILFAVVIAMMVGGVMAILLGLPRHLRAVLIEMMQEEAAARRGQRSAPAPAWPPEEEDEDEDEEEGGEIDYRQLGKMTVDIARQIQKELLVRMVAEAPASYLRTVPPDVIAIIRERLSA